MASETKNCQNCKKDFTIEPDDFSFYERIKVPPPTFCPECRLQRRLVWRNERSLYKRTCELCGEVTISMYNEESPYPVYCSKCWWSDGWDPMRYGRNYNFSRPFFEQFKDLMLRVPRVSLGHKDAVDSPYTNYIVHVKNSYLVFGGHDVEDSSYVALRSHFLKDCLDVDQIHHSESCYWSMDCNKCYRVFFSQYCDGCNDSRFLFDCRNCANCIACVGLRGKQYHILNQAYSKEDYLKKVEELELGSWKGVQNLWEKCVQLRLKLPRRYAMILQSANVSGDDIMGVRNCRNCFAVSNESENCAYLWSMDRVKESHDINFSYLTEFSYEGMSTVEGQRMFFGNVAWTNHETSYVDNCHDCGNLFGCAGLRSKEYCILNKQYTKEEYEAIVPKVIKHMNDMPYKDAKDRIYKYGEFFPPELSPFAYNETIAQEYFPLTKEEALRQGYRWREPDTKQYNITEKPENLPDNIKDVPDSITEEVIGCAHQGTCTHQCTTAFKITSGELQFYRHMNLPLPRLCPNCRHHERLAQRNPLRLWYRKCQCAGIKSENGVYQNTAKHQHGTGKCLNEFETSYAPERKEIVYCEQCYNAEVI